MVTKIKIVSTILATDSAGNVVDAMPVRYATGPTLNSAGQYVDPVETEIDAVAGYPVRYVAGLTTTDAAGRVVPVVPVSTPSASWSPSDLESDLLEWWNPDRSDLITLNAGGISQMLGVKNAYAMVQATAGAQPQYSATAFNGSPGFVLDGVDDCLSYETHAFPIGDNPVWIWCVCQQDALVADTGIRVAVGYGGSSATTNSVRLRRNVPTTVIRGSATVCNGAAATSLTDGESVMSSRHLMCLKVGATQSAFRLDDNTVITQAVVPATGAGRCRIGAGTGAAANFWQGKMRDVIFTAPLSAPNEALMRTFLLARRAL